MTTEQVPAEQLPMFGGRRNRAVPRLTLDERYDAWFTSPDGIVVYGEIMDRALALYDRGFRHFGIAALFESLRYEFAIRLGPDADGFRLNNSYRSRLARDLVAEHPELDGFFEMRELRS